MTTGAEAVRPNHRRRLGKAAGDCCRVEGSAAERNRLPAFFDPTANDLRVEPPRRVELQDPAAVAGGWSSGRMIG